MKEYTLLQSRLVAVLRPTFPGPKITDALCNAEQLAHKYGVSADDDAAIRRCAAEAIQLTLMEVEGRREHRCPTDKSHSR